MTLNLVRRQPEPIHEGKQQRDGAGNVLFLRLPSADGSIGYVEEGCGLVLSKAVALACGSKIGARHSGRLLRFPFGHVKLVKALVQRGPLAFVGDGFALLKDGGDLFADLVEGHLSISSGHQALPNDSTVADKMSGCQGAAA